MKKGKNEKGWTKPKSTSGQRPVRDREHGLQGQEIWYKLQELGFVHCGADSQKEKNDPLTKWEKKLESWLIWGYWEDECPGEKRVRDFLK